MSRPSLLIAEPPLQVLPSLAKAIGLNEAIVLQQVQYWVALEQGIEKDGRRWIYNTVEEWRKQFPFWSTDTIQRTLQSLRDKGLLDAQKLSSDKWKHTLYYSINYNSLQDCITATCGKRLRENAESITADCNNGITADCVLPLPQVAVIIPTENTQRVPTETNPENTSFVAQGAPPTEDASEPIGSGMGISGEENPKAKTLPRTVSRHDSRFSCLRTVPRELASVAEWFETVFWKAYPRKESAPEAWRAIQSAFKGCTDTEGLQGLILGSLCAYKDCAQWTDATKIPHPATWLNRRPWEGDAPPVASVSPAPKGFAAAQGGVYRTPAQQAAHERSMSTARFFVDLENKLEQSGAFAPKGGRA